MIHAHSSDWVVQGQYLRVLSPKWRSARVHPVMRITICCCSAVRIVTIGVIAFAISGALLGDIVRRLVHLSHPLLPQLVLPLFLLLICIPVHVNRLNLVLQNLTHLCSCYSLFLGVDTCCGRCKLRALGHSCDHGCDYLPLCLFSALLLRRCAAH